MKQLNSEQIELLRKVIQTNGGGVAYQDDTRRIDALMRRGLVQGKAGHAYRVVHTREGLNLIRKIDAEAKTSSATAY